MEVGNFIESSVGSLTAALFPLVLILINNTVPVYWWITGYKVYPKDFASDLRNNDEFDFIVIGSGSGGSVVAHELAKNPKWKILVIEAGKEPSTASEIPLFLFNLANTEEDWQYTTEPNENYCKGFKNGRCSWPRGKVLGGSSTINAMVYVRGNPRDYEEWGGFVDSDYDQYFEKSEHFYMEEYANTSHYGENGPLRLSKYHNSQPIVEKIIQAAESLGYPELPHEDTLNHRLGYFETVLTIFDGTRENSAKAFLKPSGSNGNLFVSYHTLALELIWENNNKISGVKVEINGNILSLKASKEVIVSGGAINSPQLLMLSGIGPKDHLKSLGIEVKKKLQVGRNLQDHYVFVGYMMSFNNEFTEKTNLVYEMVKYFLFETGSLGEIGITNFLGFINTENSKAEYPNIQFHHVFIGKSQPLQHEMIQKCLGLKEQYSKVFREENDKNPSLFIFPTLLHPKSRGKVELNSTDPKDKPKIYPNYGGTTQDLDTMVDGINFLENMMNTEPFRHIGAKLVDLKVKECERFPNKSREYWKCLVAFFGTTLYHPVGTCKMGPKTDPEAVVDLTLKVHGVDNLRVIDASIMPTITSGNTNAPTLMIGQRGAEIIIQDWINK